MYNYKEKKGEHVESIGQILKNARLAKRLTIEELQKITKIQTRYLEALEEDDFEAMPSMFYARTFIKQYANEVGVDADYLINRFDGRPTTETQELSAVRGSRSELYQGRHGGTVQSFRAKLPLIMLMAAVAMIIGVIAYLTLREQNSTPRISRPSEVEVASSKAKTSSEPATEVSSSETQTTEETKTSESVKKELSIAFNSEAGNQTGMTLTDATKPLKFELTSEQRSWVGITLDGGATYNYEHTLEAGENATTEINTEAKRVTLVLGNSTSVKIKVNGQELDFNPNQTGTIMRNINLTVNYAEEKPAN